MLIRRRYIRTVDTYFGGLIPRTDFKLVADTAHVPAQRLNASGYASLNNGDILLPPAVGKNTRINSEGSYITHRDRPKERRLVGRREWTREEWDGPGRTQTVTEEVDIYKDCFPRTFVPPRSVELITVDHGTSRLIISPTMTWQQTPSEEIIHTTNLMLELFGEAEVRHDNLDTFLPPNTQRVNWTLLPPGQSLTGVTAHVQGLIGRTSPTFRGPIMSRLTFLASRNPVDVYLGHGGFHAYVAYVFPNSGMTILESVMPANATYVFAGNWAAVSHLTKSQILAGSHHHARIIHDAHWETNLTQYAR